MLLVIALASLSACANTTSDPVCPTLFAYSPELQTRAANELEGLAPESALGRMMVDYGVNRAEIRACRGDER